jgi:hypothetical protein
VQRGSQAENKMIVCSAPCPLIIDERAVTERRDESQYLIKLLLPERTAYQLLLAWAGTQPVLWIYTVRMPCE